MKLAWLKSSACTYCCIDKLTITKNGDGVRFCLQGFSCRKEAKVATLISLWRREVLIKQVQPVFCCWSHVIICCTALYCTPVTDQYNYLRIYCLFYTVAWQMLIRTELAKLVFITHLLSSLFINLMLIFLFYLILIFTVLRNSFKILNFIFY